MATTTAKNEVPLPPDAAWVRRLREARRRLVEGAGELERLLQDVPRFATPEGLAGLLAVRQDAGLEPGFPGGVDEWAAGRWLHMSRGPTPGPALHGIDELARRGLQAVENCIVRLADGGTVPGIASRTRDRARPAEGRQPLIRLVSIGAPGFPVLAAVAPADVREVLGVEVPEPVGGWMTYSGRPWCVLGPAVSGGSMAGGGIEREYYTARSAEEWSAKAAEAQRAWTVERERKEAERAEYERRREEAYRRGSMSPTDLLAEKTAIELEAERAERARLEARVRELEGQQAGRA